MSYFPLNTRQNTLPVQMLPLKEKDKEWKKANMDALESIGRKQYLDNLEILENYRMVNNELLYNHYIFSSSATDLAQAAVKEFDLPPYLRNYDITGKVVKRLSGQFQAMPDIFRVAATDEFSTNEYLESKKNLLNNIVTTRFQDFVKAQLKAEGIDPDDPNVDPQQLQQEEQKFTPDQVEMWMREKYRAVPEKWGEMVLKLDKQRFNTPELEMVEFEDMLICDRAYRHFYLKANGLGYGQETWNPIRVFWHKSPDVKYVEEGDYVGRVFYLSLPEIINRYGHKMRKKDLESLYGDYLSKKKMGGAEYSFFQATNVPFEQYPEYGRTIQAFGFDPHTGVPFTGNPGNITNQDVDVLFNSSSTSYNLAGLTLCTEAYWRSQCKVGFLIMKDPETGEIIEEMVDETFIVPDFVTEVEDDPTYEDFVYYPQKKMNTIRWTWINQVWGGIKINVASQDKDTDALYLDVKPLPFQFKGDTNPYECKLPVCGSVFNNRNAKSMSLVSLMKPYQILFNVFMNKIYHLASTTMDKFLMLDPRMIPNDKNLGGERGLQKMLTSTKETKIMQVDTSPTGGGKVSNTLTVQDLSEYTNMEAAIKIANIIQEMALMQVGITMQSLGMDDGEYTAEGVRQKSRGSTYLMESWFTRFSNYIMRVKQMNLDIAQYCTATNRDMTLSLIQDDMQREFFTMNGVDILNSQLGVRVFTSQELLRQTELLKELALKNNTSSSPLSSLAEVIYTQSPARIIEVLKKGEAEIQKQVQAKFQQDQSLIQQKSEADAQKQAAQNQWQADQNQLDRESKIREAIIKQVGFDSDAQGNDQIDVVGIGSLELDAQRLDHERVAASRDALNTALSEANRAAAEREKNKLQKQLQDKDHALKREEMTNRIKIENKKQDQIEVQNKSQERMAKDKHKADIAVMNKQLELKDKEIEVKQVGIHTEKKMAVHKVASEQHKANTDKALGNQKVRVEGAIGNEKVKEVKALTDEKIKQTRAVNKLKLATAKKVEAQRAKDASKPKPTPKK